MHANFANTVALNVPRRPRRYTADTRSTIPADVRPLGICSYEVLSARRGAALGLYPTTQRFLGRNDRPDQFRPRPPTNDRARPRRPARPRARSASMQPMDDAARQRKKEKMERLQRERPKPIEGRPVDPSKSAEERLYQKSPEVLAREEEEARQRAAEEAARAAEREAAEREEARLRELEEQKRLEAEAAEQQRIAVAQEAERRRRAEQAAVERRRRTAEAAQRRAEDEEARKVAFGRHDDFEALDHLRESSLPATAFGRFLVVEQNRQLGHVEREERQELLLIKDENAAVWSERGRERVRERIMRDKRSSRLKKEMQERSRDQARAAKKMQEAGRRLLNERQRDFEDEMRMRVLDQKAEHAALKADTAAQAEQRRREGADSREECAKAVAAMRRRLRRDKQHVTSHMRSSLVSRSSVDISDHPCRACLTDRDVVRAHSRSGREVRTAEKAWKREHMRTEQSYIDQARILREKAMRQRERTKAAVAESLVERAKSADELRMTNFMFEKETAKAKHQLAQQKALNVHDQAYRHKYASKQEAGLFDTSSWFKLTGWFKGPPVRSAQLELEM